ncbi:polysaccharide lyase [Sphingomonas sp. LB-2]|uniref:polysaccharide lyase n=1 Tax=Sphingomonas caeni TaxID=2984949 RepID=UPI00222ED45E|nr:polysaccharide lyase [Sphingomonas caeni]MCW3846618.1 polysaccharide lyase [Sphingomonas caeni]
MALTGAGAGARQGARPVIAEGFEGNGAVAQALLRDPRLTLADGAGVGGGRALRASYIGGPVGSERLTRSIDLGERGPEYTLDYDVQFERDFQFVLGGKLLGLGPDRPVTGGDPIRPDGWSARVMWRTGGHVELYTYHQDQAGKYGDHGVVVRPLSFVTGRWYAVSIHVRVNSAPDKADGFVRLYVDGVLTEQQQGIRLRGATSDDTLISRFMFETFHGGNDPSWAPKNSDGSYATVHALFDNIAVWRGEHVRRAPGQ